MPRKGRLIAIYSEIEREDEVIPVKITGRYWPPEPVTRYDPPREVEDVEAEGPSGRVPLTDAEVERFSVELQLEAEEGDSW